MKRVGEFTQEYLLGEKNVPVNVFVDGATVYHVVQYKNIGVYREISPATRRFPTWQDVPDELGLMFERAKQ